MIWFGIWCIVIPTGILLFDSAPILVATGKLMLFEVLKKKWRGDSEVS